jgi:hypothetical protein
MEGVGERYFGGGGGGGGGGKGGGGFISLRFNKNCNTSLKARNN